MTDTRVSRPATLRWKHLGWGLAALALLAPLIGMQVSDAVRWDAADFALLAGMFLAAGIGYELVERWTPQRRVRLLGGLALLLGVLLVWAEAAVGLID